jgi:hypothetical protein
MAFVIYLATLSKLKLCNVTVTYYELQMWFLFLILRYCLYLRLHSYEWQDNW